MDFYAVIGQIVGITGVCVFFSGIVKRRVSEKKEQTYGPNSQTNRQKMFSVSNESG